MAPLRRNGKAIRAAKGEEWEEVVAKGDMGGYESKLS